MFLTIYLLNHLKMSLYKLRRLLNDICNLDMCFSLKCHWNTCRQVGQVFLIANHPLMHTWQKVCWPSQSRRNIFLPFSISPIHITHWSPTNDLSAWNFPNLWILAGKRPLKSCFFFIANCCWNWLIFSVISLWKFSISLF